MRSSLVVILSLALLAGCAAPSAQESAEIAAGGDAWMAAFNAGDVDALVSLYAADARFLPPNSEMVSGHDPIRADLQGMLDAGLSGELQTTEAMAAGDIGYRVGTYTLSSADGQVVDKGKYIETWQRMNGEWKITNDIYNSDMPAGPQGTAMIATHEVGDGAVWMAAWMDSDERRAQFAANGVASVQVFQNPDNPNLTGLLLDVTDMEAFQAWLASEDGAATAAADTVDLSKTSIAIAVE